MENKDVPYIVYEGAMARAERHIKRLVIALIFAILMICVSNIAWLYVWNSYEYVGDSSVNVEGENANYIGNDGDISNGESNSNKN
jgi:cell division septal protein FtsQ